MYITKKGQYALYFMIELALNNGKPVAVKSVSKKYDLSEKFLEQIATQLGRSGVVNVIRGSKGGYYLSKNVREYTLETILDSVEGKKISVDVNMDQLSDNNRILCSVVDDIGKELDSAIYGVLENITLEDMVSSYRNQMDFAYVI